MSKPIFLVAATAAMIAATSLAAAPNAEAHKYRRGGGWGGVYVAIGPPIVYGGYDYYREGRYVAGPYYYGGRYEPYCHRWGWVYSRSGKAKWRCVAW
jgi:hypothetical protein